MDTITAGKTQDFLDKINKNFKELADATKNITYGVEAPNDSEGSDGDIYIQYEN